MTDPTDQLTTQDLDPVSLESDSFARPAASMRRLTTVWAVLALMACGGEPKSAPLFELLSPQSTGVNFVNQLPETSDFNIINYLYYYNGGGVAVGDVDGDGLQDLYFTSNIGPNRLYRNRGNYNFEDITVKAGVADPIGWKTGVTMADVNGDGHVDIYVSGVDFLSMHGRNVLYINNGDATFADRTKEYGLEFVGYATQALFFDYDGDGDLDMYLLNNSTHREREIGTRAQRAERNLRAGDRLYRNDGHRFADVSEAAGVADKGVDGYGLGVVASDLNDDGCPDLYVANDFQGDDYLYINNCKGGFRQSVAQSMPHTSRFSMGVDAADFNNDGRFDLMVLDMFPEREEILKTSANAEAANVYEMRLGAGYHPQLTRNTLQLNRGAGRFSDIGYLAGVFATDWSWSPLFADLDNDGLKDLFITNGIYRRPNDLDFLSYVSQMDVQYSLSQGVTRENIGLLRKLPHVPLANYAFHNNGNLTFTNLAGTWGLAQQGFSNGAAYVDLNNSGELDLVVNNIGAPVSIYRNRARGVTGNSYLTVALRGTGANTAGFGSKVIVKGKGAMQVLEQAPTRGFLSSVDPRPHFGLGKSTQVDSLIVIWPDRRFQVLTDVSVNRTVVLSQADASGKYDYERDGAPQVRTAVSPRSLSDVTDKLGLDFKHHESPFFDWNREPLIPHLVSIEGPALAVADVNGDKLDDVYIGGGKWQQGELFLQQQDGTFRGSAQAAFATDSVAEDVDAAFFDADGDGHLDLFVVSGGNEFWGSSEQLRSRLYTNDGKGNFQRAVGALPDIFENGGTVAVGDFNGDDHLDLFIGSRVVSRRYGETPKSHLLQNDGTGRFTDVTAVKAPQLSEAGMVSSSAWVDYDNDGKLDLVVAGEWMPVRVFHQERGRLVERTREVGLSGTNGWWNSITVADLRGNGRKDLVLGNLGLNSYLKASAKEPVRLYLNDFAKNGTLAQILTFYKNGVSYPVAGRDELIAAIPSLKSKYPSYTSFGAARLEDIIPEADMKSSKVLEATTFASAVALNNGNGTFTLRELPIEAQFSPTYSSVAEDFDGDGKTDLLLGGNFGGVTPLYGPYDASYGLLLHGMGDGSFQAVDMEKSGVMIEGQVRRMKSLRDAKGNRLIVIARNNDKVRLLRVNSSPVN